MRFVVALNMCYHLFHSFELAPEKPLPLTQRSLPWYELFHWPWVSLANFIGLHWPYFFLEAVFSNLQPRDLSELLSILDQNTCMLWWVECRTVDSLLRRWVMHWLEFPRWVILHCGPVQYKQLWSSWEMATAHLANEQPKMLTPKTPGLLLLSLLCNQGFQGLSPSRALHETFKFLHIHSHTSLQKRMLFSLALVS